MTDAYAYWRDACAGTFGPISPDDPKPGRYRMRKGKGGPYLPVAIFTNAKGELVAAVGKEFVEATTIWTWCADKPVSEADYKVALSTGKWPGDVDIGHNCLSKVIFYNKYKQYKLRIWLLMAIQQYLDNLLQNRLQFL